MSTATKKQVRPIEQFDRFMLVGVDLGSEGVVLARTGNGYLVWFPGHTCWAPLGRRGYAPVSLYWIYHTATGHWMYPCIESGGRFDKARYEKLLDQIRTRMGVDITIEDIDVKRRTFTTVFD
jgi:hypothetical protein